MKTIKLFNSDKVVLVDDSDFDEMSKYNWTLTESKPGFFYAIARINNENVYMHKLLLQRFGTNLVE